MIGMWMLLLGPIRGYNLLNGAPVYTCIDPFHK